MKLTQPLQHIGHYPIVEGQNGFPLAKVLKECQQEGTHSRSLTPIALFADKMFIYKAAGMK